MASVDPVGSVQVPKSGNWPGPIESYRTIKPYLKPQIWNLVSVWGLALIFYLIADFALRPGATRNLILYSFLNDIAGLIILAFFETALIVMVFTYLQKKEVSLSEALKQASNYFLPMLGLFFITVVILLASIILLVIPFFFILPRICLAPYFLIKNDLPVNKAIAASWYSTKGNVKKVYGIIAIQVGVAILFITIIGIPFAIYFGIMNIGSFALLTLYLSQPKDKAKLKSQTN